MKKNKGLTYFRKCLFEKEKKTSFFLLVISLFFFSFMFSPSLYASYDSDQENQSTEESFFTAEDLAKAIGSWVFYSPNKELEEKYHRDPEVPEGSYVESEIEYEKLAHDPYAVPDEYRIEYQPVCPQSLKEESFPCYLYVTPGTPPWRITRNDVSFDSANNAFVLTVLTGGDGNPEKPPEDPKEENPECRDDSECEGEKVCKEERCVPKDGITWLPTVYEDDMLNIGDDPVNITPPYDGGSSPGDYSGDEEGDKDKTEYSDTINCSMSITADGFEETVDYPGTIEGNWSLGKDENQKKVPATVDVNYPCADGWESFDYTIECSGKAGQGSVSGNVQCPVCGDGKVNGSDECDDRGIVDGDGCSSSCLYETVDIECDDPDSGSRSGSEDSGVSFSCSSIGETYGEYLTWEVDEATNCENLTVGPVGEAPSFTGITCPEGVTTSCTVSVVAYNAYGAFDQEIVSVSCSLEGQDCTPSPSDPPASLESSCNQHSSAGGSTDLGTQCKNKQYVTDSSGNCTKCKDELTERCQCGGGLSGADCRTGLVINVVE